MAVDGQPIPLAADGLPKGTPDAYGIPTLGWGVLAWAEAFLAQPDGDHAGEPWQWTTTQARLVTWWYAVDQRGRWLWRRGQIVLPKGAGKSPLAAALSCCALAAETVFDGFDAFGEAVGRQHPSPHVQLAAVSQDQTDNTMSLVLAMLGDGQAANTIPGLDLGLTRVRTRNGRLVPVTASAPSREGQRLTDAILDEPHLWTDTNGGTRLAATLRRNLGKTNGRSLETTNAWNPGEESVAEQTAVYADKIAEGSAVDVGLMRYHPKALVRDLADRDQLRRGLQGLYADSPWVDVERIMAEVYDLGTHPADARRYYLNEVAVAEDAWVAPREWATCADPSAVIGDGDEITLFFDGSKSNDATGLIACHMESGHVFTVGVWEPDPTDPDDQVPVNEVEAAVAMAFDRWNPVAFFADVREWESYVHTAWPDAYADRLLAWANPHGRNAGPIAWDMRARTHDFTLACETCHTEILERRFTHDGDTRVARHVANARRAPNRWGTSIRKETPRSRKKIDAAVCVVGARMVRAIVLASPEWAKRTSRQNRTGRVYGF